MGFDGIKRTALERITAGTEGARLIGSQLTGVAGSNVQLLLEGLLARVLPSGGTTGQVLKKTSGADYATSWQTESGGGSTQPFPDNTALVKNNADNTKLVRLDAATVAAGTTRVLTMPNSDVALANVPAIASQAQADVGTDDTTIMTPQKSAKSERFAGVIQGAGYSWVSATQYTVAPGRAMVNGTWLTWASSITRTPTLTANTIHYIYLFDSGSRTAAIEESTTAPVWDDTNNYWRKGADATRRCLGFIQANATPAIRRFTLTTMGRERTFHYASGEVLYVVTNDAGSTTAWTSFTLAPYVPAHATDYKALSKLSIAANEDAAFGVSPIDLGSSVLGTEAPFAVRMNSTITTVLFLGTAWFPIEASQTNYFRVRQFTGTVEAYLMVVGTRFSA